MRRLTMMVAMGALVTGAAVAQTTVTTSGGNTNAVPVYTGSSTLGNSPISVMNGTTALIQSSNVPLMLQSTGNGGAGGATSFNMDPAGTGLYVYPGYPLEPHGGYHWQLGTNDNTSSFDVSNFNWTRILYVGGTGNVGIGTTSPGATLEVDGNVKLTSGSGASITFADGTVQNTAYTGASCGGGGDFAESVDVAGRQSGFHPGDVLVLTANGKGDVTESSTPYSTMVAGIYSTKPGYVGRRLTGPKGTGEIPMAMVGIVPTKVTAENGPIHRGDLLVSASLRGYAMKGTDRGRMLGAVIGKAMGTLESGTGVIEVLVTLQ